MAIDNDDVRETIILDGIAQEVTIPKPASVWHEGKEISLQRLTRILQLQHDKRVLCNRMRDVFSEYRKVVAELRELEK